MTETALAGTTATEQPCCGTAEAAAQAGTCCDPAAKAEAQARGASCCGAAAATGTAAPDPAATDPAATGATGSGAGDAEQIRAEVRARYADAAARAAEGARCGSDNLYPDADRAQLPDGAARASLGCGNPLLVADLRPGDTVLDLGSGGGIDVLLSARRVGPTGHVHGLDMTDEMLELARRNAAEAGADNVTFHKGHIEDIPLPDASVDVVISNCVINLSADKPSVFTEMFRVLRPGGRVGVSDVVADDRLTAEQRRERGDWAGCVAGALSRTEYINGLTAAGFTDVTVEFGSEYADGMHAAIIKARRP